MKIVLVVGCLVACTSSAGAQDRVIGLLTLPEVFGNGACDRFSPQEVLKSVRARGELWFQIEVMSHSECEGISEPKVIDRGWVAAHARSGQPSIWFASRGC